MGLLIFSQGALRMLDIIRKQAGQALQELLSRSRVQPGEIVVLGCSSSAVAGAQIGSASSAEVGNAIFETLNPICAEKQVYLAVQCCEHLNRALVIEREAQMKYHLEEVNAVPRLKAGGSAATAAYQGMHSPVLVESVSAVCGMDIGGTLIGMHLKRVAVPVSLSVRQIGEAVLICARTRPKFVGGERAEYNKSLY